MTTADLDLRQIALQSEPGSVDGLASLVAHNEGATVEKLAALARLDIGVMQRLMTVREFRERVTELMTYRELDVEKERTILRKMLGEATNPDAGFKTFERAATWVYRQGGMLRADRSEVDIKNSIQITFTRDLPPDADFAPPNPLAGVKGLEDGKTIEVSPADDSEGQGVAAGDAGDDE